MQLPVSKGVFVDPVPLNDTFCGLPVASSDIESVPVTAPEPPGVKVTLIVQVSRDSRLPTQVLCSAKLLLAVIFATLSATAP
jgi:hypothetical protein